MYSHRSGAGRKHYVVFTDLVTGRQVESPAFKTKAEANKWIERHVANDEAKAAAEAAVVRLGGEVGDG